MKKTVAILLCLALLAGFCGFTLRSAGEAGVELVEETLLAPVGVPAAESGEPAGDVAPEPVGEALDASSAEEPASQEAVSQEPAVNGAPASRVIVNAVGMESGKYKTTDGSVVSGFVYGVTTDYVLGFADGVLYLNGYTMTPNGVDYGVITEGDLTVVLEGSNQMYGAVNAIRVDGTLTIRGSGRLTATGDGDGLSASGDLTIESGIVAAHGTDFDGVYSQNGTISIRGTADVTATGGEAGLATYNGNISISGSAVVNATGDQFGIYTPDGVIAVFGDATVSATGDAAGIYTSTGSVSITGNASVTAIGVGYEAEKDGSPYSPMRMSALEDGKELVVDPAADGIPVDGVGIRAPTWVVTLSCEAVLAGANKAGARRVAVADYLAAMDSYAYVSIPYVAPAPAPTLAPAAKAPATGDGASPLLWLALLAVAGGGLVLLPRKKSRT